jgi:hypothetical protein
MMRYRSFQESPYVFGYQFNFRKPYLISLVDIMDIMDIMNRMGIIGIMDMIEIDQSELRVHTTWEVAGGARKS